jgi:hypothetical protein
MPKIIVTFRVEFAKEPALCRWKYLQVTDLSIITELTRLGFRIVTGPLPDRIGEAVEVTGDAQARNVKAAFQLLSEHGYLAYPGPTVPPSLRANHFAPWRERILAPRPKMHADYFSPNLYPRTKNCPATWCGTTEDGNCIIRLDERQKNKLELGWSDIDTRLLATYDLFSKLRDAGFAEITWLEVAYDRPRKARKRLGTLSSNIVMPPCLTPRVDEEGETWQDEREDGLQREHCRWNDGGCVPPILAFERPLVESLGRFDLATTRERTGSLRIETFHPSLIASRRFCEFVERHAKTNLTWAPVRLLSPRPSANAAS